MYLLLPLTKGHLSTVATISWQIGGLIREGLLYNPQILWRSQMDVLDGHLTAFCNITITVVPAI